MKTKLFTGMKKNFLTATLLALVLAVGIFPATAFAASGTPMTEVNISITKPAVGATPDSQPTITTKPQNGAQLYSVEWYKVAENGYNGDINDDIDWEEVDDNAKFEAGYYYLATVNVKANNDFFFSQDEMLVTVNDKWADKATIGRDQGREDCALQALYVFQVTNHTHTYSLDKWSSNASSHWHQCTDANCPDKAASIKDTAKHTFKWVVDRKATADQVGLKHEECTVCGYTRNENTKITNSPQTGDNMNIVLPLGIMLVSGAGVGAAVYRKKQHN